MTFFSLPARHFALSLLVLALAVAWIAIQAKPIQSPPPPLHLGSGWQEVSRYPAALPEASVEAAPLISESHQRSLLPPQHDETSIPIPVSSETGDGPGFPGDSGQAPLTATPVKHESVLSHWPEEISVLDSVEAGVPLPVAEDTNSFQPISVAKATAGNKPATKLNDSAHLSPEDDFPSSDRAPGGGKTVVSESSARAVESGHPDYRDPFPSAFAPSDFSEFASSNRRHDAEATPRPAGPPALPDLSTPEPTVITAVEPTMAPAFASLPSAGLSPGSTHLPTTELPSAGTSPLASSPNGLAPATGYLIESLKPPRTNDGCEVAPVLDDFSAPPIDYNSFDPTADMQIYQGKRLYATQRPLLELGRPWYQLGQLAPPDSWLGLHNPVSQQFLVFGDVRSAVAANQLGGDSQSLLAWQANLFFDWRLTGTERFHFNITPNTQGANNSRYLFDEDDFISEFNADLNFGFFEGDVGAILGGFTNTTLPFDLPIALGVMPLVIQNGIWLDDAFLGAAATLPAQNSPLLDISNYDITFFAGWDKLNSPAFGADDNAAKLYGVASWWEALNGYIEADYAFIEDRDSLRDRSYHNLGLSYTRRFGHLLSNSTRVIVNAGQSTLGGPNTADGVLLLSENSLITANPSTILPYFNLFAGFDRPQSVGRAGIAGGILRNTGILFESDNLTGYPTLDATANQTYGMALGLSLMPQDFSQQLVLEAAMLGVMGDDLERNAVAAQRGLGFRYQLPLNNSIIFRVDGMYGFLAETEDISGLRVELRRKF